MTPLFSYRFEVRFRDCDAMGHVNNAVYLTYLEQARFAHWRALGRFGGEVDSLASGAASGAARDIPGVILARAEIDYRKPAKYGDELEVRLGIASFGRTSLTYEYEIVDAAGDVVAGARTVIVSYDYQRNTPVPISDEMKATLSRPLV